MRQISKICHIFGRKIIQQDEFAHKLLSIFSYTTITVIQSVLLCKHKFFLEKSETPVINSEYLKADSYTPLLAVYFFLEKRETYLLKSQNQLIRSENRLVRSHTFFLKKEKPI